MRIEDIDPPRAVDGAARDIVRALDAHGLRHDGEVRYQSASRSLHDSAIESLLESGQAYYCRCTRKALRAAGQLDRYPGTCRERGLTHGAVRVRVPEAPIRIVDRWQGTRRFDLSEHPGDFVIRRRDGLIAYQLAVVVDDADQGITDIVRGYDLYDSTPRQAWLQTLLGLATPRYAHFPVLVDQDGLKLSKQTGAPELRTDRAGDNLLRALSILGMPAPASRRAAGVEALLDWARSRYDPNAFSGRRVFRLPDTAASDDAAD